MLNATFEPLCVVPVRRAVVLVLKEKAEIVEHNGVAFRSERATIPAPSVIRLVHFVRVPFRSRVPLSRRAVFIMADIDASKGPDTAWGMSKSAWSHREFGALLDQAMKDSPR